VAVVAGTAGAGTAGAEPPYRPVPGNADEDVEGVEARQDNTEVVAFLEAMWHTKEVRKNQHSHPHSDHHPWLSALTLAFPLAFVPLASTLAASWALVPW